MDLERLDAKGILEDEVFIELFEETDDVQRARMIVDCTDRAKALGVKQKFDTLLKAYSKSKRQHTASTGGNYTEFDGPYPKLYTGGWMANENGISILTNFGMKEACSHPILPIRTLVNAETGYVKAVLAFKRRNRWKEIIVDQELISSNNRIVGLARHGVRVTSENARALVQYLSDLSAMNEDQIQEQLSTSKLGWLKGRFIPYDESVVFDNDDALSGAFQSIRESGAYEAWLNLTRGIRAGKRMEPKLYLAAAFASPLLSLFNALPFIVSAYGTTGKGKTVALMLAASVWADPTEGKYFVRAKANEIALEARLDFLNHLPLAVDDLSQIQRKVKDDFSEYIYTLCSGGGKERSNVNIGLQRQRFWKNIILTNSERSLITETMQGGAINRILEMECGEGDIFNDATRVVDTIKEHYGSAGKDFIRTVSLMTHDELKEIQSGFLGRLRQRMEELGVEKEEKQLIPMSILLTADQIATEHIFEDGRYLDFNACFDLLKGKEDICEEERAYGFIMSDIQVHLNNFRPDQYGTYRGEIWGMLEPPYAVIHNNIFKGMCERGNFSGKSFLSWADRRGLLKYGPDTKVKKLAGKAARCIFLQMDEGDEGGSTDADGFLEVGDQEELPFK